MKKMPKAPATPSDKVTGYGVPAYHCRECDTLHAGNMQHSASLLACPFCGYRPVFGYWHGGGPRKRMVQCDAERCDVQPSVCGNTARQAFDKWNRRS